MPEAYCAFSKAVEHLGDRWSLLIVRVLAAQGPLGFNALAASLPGIGRSVLSRRLRKLADLGVVERPRLSRVRRPQETEWGRPGSDGQRPYRLAPAGERLVPTLLSLREWAERWLPEHPDAAKRDPTIILLWLQARVAVDRVPVGQVVLEFDLHLPRGLRHWLVLERGTAPSLCFEDPGLPVERYVYVEVGAAALLPIARGRLDWSEAVAARSVTLFGEPSLIRALPGWFVPADEPEARSAAAG